MRGSRFEGAIFKRQVPFDRYAADFTCHGAKLVIDPGLPSGGDGKQHDCFVDYDDARTQVIKTFGVRVIRFTNDEVCADVIIGSALDSQRVEAAL